METIKGSSTVEKYGIQCRSCRRLCHPKLVKGQTGLSPVTPIISNGLRYCRPVARCFPTALTTDVIKCIGLVCSGSIERL